jgi:hypothetical protein
MRQASVDDTLDLELPTIHKVSVEFVINIGDVGSRGNSH